MYRNSSLTILCTALITLINYSSPCCAQATHSNIAEEKQPSLTIKKEISNAYINKEGHVVLKTTFQNVGAFSEGLAAVEREGKVGYIDKSGKIVLAPKYIIHKAVEYACGTRGSIDTYLALELPDCAFSEGLAAVRLAQNQQGRNWGYIYKSGKIAIPPQFDEAGCFREGLAPAVLGGKLGFIDKTGQFIIEPRFGCQIKDNGLALPKDSYFSEGLAAVTLCGKGCTYVNRMGKLIMPLQFHDINAFSEGVALVSKRKNQHLTKLPDGTLIKVGGKDEWYFINKSGKQCIKGKFYGGKSFAQGLAPVCVCKGPYCKWGFIDKNGRFVIKLKFEGADSFSCGLTSVCLKGKFGCIDRKGNLVIKPQYDWPVVFSEGLAAVKQ